MIVTDWICAGLPALLDEARATTEALRPLTMGVVHVTSDGTTLFGYVDLLGSTVYAVAADDLPEAFRPRKAGSCRVLPDDLARNPGGLLESRLLHGTLPAEMRRPPPLRQIVTLPIPGAAPDILIAGLGEGRPATGDESTTLAAVAASAAALIGRRETAAEELERLRRLESVERLLPVFVNVLDVRDIFERLSVITNDVIAHDFASMGMFNESLTHLTKYAESSAMSRAPFSGPMPYPPSQTAAWRCRYVGDLRDHPVDSITDLAARDGGRGSIRVGIRLDDRLLGALNFTSLQPWCYTALDLAVARRVADYIALAISHHRLAEEGRRAAALEERNTKLEVRVKALTEELDSRTGYRRMAGESKEWKQVLTQATKVAATDTTVLLLGESGTGKEVVARFLHRASPRTNGPFLAMNCAALPEQLLEAELFGYERGAYTGATQSKAGQLELASGGTLFLDEVGEMNPSAQAKFLRVLQEREFQRLGGTRVLRTDARIVAATNRDLERAISLNQFREDLYYRLNVFAIELPALRERPDDILPLSEAFLAEFAQRFGRPPAGVSRDARKLLLDYHWPGNVRELRNSLERASILCEGGLITPEHFSLKLAATRPQPAAPMPVAMPQAAPPIPPPAPVTPPGGLPGVEKTLIEQALQQARFNKSKAAKALGLTRQQLYVRMRRYGLE